MIHINLSKHGWAHFVFITIGLFNTAKANGEFQLSDKDGHGRWTRCIVPEDTVDRIADTGLTGTAMFNALLGQINNYYDYEKVQFELYSFTPVEGATLTFNAPLKEKHKQLLKAEQDFCYDEAGNEITGNVKAAHTFLTKKLGLFGFQFNIPLQKGNIAVVAIKYDASWLEEEKQPNAKVLKSEFNKVMTTKAEYYAGKQEKIKTWQANKKKENTKIKKEQNNTTSCAKALFCLNTLPACGAIAVGWIASPLMMGASGKSYADLIEDGNEDAKIDEQSQWHNGGWWAKDDGKWDDVPSGFSVKDDPRLFKMFGDLGTKDGEYTWGADSEIIAHVVLAVGMFLLGLSIVGLCCKGSCCGKPIFCERCYENQIGDENSMV